MVLLKAMEMYPTHVFEMNITGTKDTEVKFLAATRTFLWGFQAVESIVSINCGE